MADDQALKEAQDRFERARRGVSIMRDKLDEILVEYKRDERLSSVESFKQFREYARKRLDSVQEDLNLIFGNSLRW